MKKVISIVLALLMMIPMAAMLVPTASAASTATDLTPGSSGKVYYEQDFNDPALADLEDDALAEALGWAAPSGVATMWMEDGKVRIFTQYTPSGVYPATENKWAGGYNSGWLVNDPNLVRNTTVFEWKFTYNRHAASTAEQNNDVTVTKKDGTEKTVKADGQGGYQTATFIYGSSVANSAAAKAGSDNQVIRINQDGTGWANTHKSVDSATDNTVYWKTTTYQQVNALPAGDTCVLEMHNDPVNTAAEAQRTSTIMNREYSVKVIIEPWAGRLFGFVDGQLFIAKCAEVNGTTYSKNDWARLVGDQFAFYVKPGMDVTVDDIKVTEYVPNLTISEVMVNGTKASGTGKYQWIEITNPSAAPVNVYDYAIHLETMANNYNTPAYTIGCETDQGTGAWYVGAASTLGYFTPGAKTLGTETFDSPSYENGVLQPGETAIVLFPQTAMAGGTSVTDEAFNAYLQGLGMPEGTKTFVVDNESEYNFTLGTLTNESVTVQIVKATNTATDGGYKPVADCKGQVAEWSPAYAECSVWVTSKGSGSGTAFWAGMTVKEAQGYPRSGLSGNIALTSDSSFEISYSGWVNEYAQQQTEFAHTNIVFGFSKVKAGVDRIGINGTAVKATPGYVPVECRRVNMIDVTDVDGNSEKIIVPVNTDYTVATPIVPGYDTRVFVNGELAVAKAEAETTNVTINGYADIKVELYREGSAFIGYQTTAVDQDGCYDLRLLAAVNSFDYDALGFRVTFNDGIDESSTLECEVQYVYTDVTATYADDSTENYNAQEDFKSNYLYALHIKDIDAGSTWTIKVEAIYMVDGEWQTGSVNVWDGEFFEIELD